MSKNDRELCMQRAITRRDFGNITIANTASGADDSTELAIDMAARAVHEYDIGCSAIRCWRVPTTRQHLMRNVRTSDRT